MTEPNKDLFRRLQAVEKRLDKTIGEQAMFNAYVSNMITQIADKQNALVDRLAEVGALEDQKKIVSLN